VVRTAKLQRELERLTPFRWRATSATADAALGWTVLWDLMASSSGTDETGVAVPEDVVQRATAYLESTGLRQSTEIRGCIRRMLGPTAPNAPVDDDDSE